MAVGNVPPGVGQPVPDPNRPHVVVAFLAAHDVQRVGEVVQHEGLTGLDDVNVPVEQAVADNARLHLEQPGPDQVLVVHAVVGARGGVGIDIHEVHNLPGLVADRFLQDLRVHQRVHGRPEQITVLLDSLLRALLCGQVAVDHGGTDDHAVNVADP